MKKSIIAALTLGVLFLTGCTTEYPAKEGHLEKALFNGQNTSASLMFVEGTLQVMNNNFEVTPNTDPKEIEEKMKEETAIPQNGEYSVDISASGDTYNIQTKSGEMFTLTRIGDRLVEDEKGNRYASREYVN